MKTSSLAAVLPCCPLCGGAFVPYLAQTYDFHYGIPGSWDYQRCKYCDVVFLNPAPTQDFLDGAYKDDYYSYQEFTAAPARGEKLFRTLLCYNPKATGDPRFDRPGRVLDIGCGSGEFLFQLKSAGWETAGVEVNRKAVEVGNRHGLNLQAGTIASVTLPAEYFDYVRLNHSFEHLLQPKETLRLVHGFLKPNGLLFIGVPNVDGIMARMFGRCWWNLGPPVHPFGYSIRALRVLLTDHKFEVVRARTNSNFAGLVGSLQMLINNKRGLRSDRGRVLENMAAKLVGQWIAKLTDIFSAGDCLEVIARKV